MFLSWSTISTRSIEQAQLVLDVLFYYTRMDASITFSQTCIHVKVVVEDSTEQYKDRSLQFVEYARHHY